MKNATRTEMLIAYAFTIVELRILFEKEVFRDLIAQMETIEDAVGVIHWGDRILNPKMLGNKSRPDSRACDSGL